MKLPKVTVTRRLTPQVEAHLRAHFDVSLNASDVPFTTAQLADALAASDGLICTVSDRIDADLLSRQPRRAGIIANVGVGYSNIDVTAARAAGIVVTNTPDVLTEATADIAWLLILAATRRAYAGEARLRRGDWQGFSLASELGMSLQGRTLGIVGMGRIGRAVARRAVLGFGMQVIYYNRSSIDHLDFTAEARTDLARLMREADVVSLHIPGGADGPLVTADLLAQMKPTAWLVNTARGEVVDQACLIELLETRRIAGAGLDVYVNEPQVPDRLKVLDNVTLLPHIGSATLEVRDAMGMLAANNVSAHFTGAAYPSRVV